MSSFSSVFLLEARRVTVRVDRDELLMELKVPPRNVPSHRVRIVPRGVYHQILHFSFCSNLEDGVFGLETAASSAEMRREPPASCRSGQNLINASSRTRHTCKKRAG